MHKVIVFDLDGTLAAVGKGMTEGDLELLKKLESEGYTVAICSGKPTYYLCGFMRQAGLKNPILVGENGGTFQFGVDLPPKEYFVHPFSKKAAEQLSALKALFDGALGDGLWYQPNEIGLTPFPKDKGEFDCIQNILDQNPDLLTELCVYRHADSFDLVPRGISKHSGLGLLAKQLFLTGADFIAVGDGVNDIPMFEFADISVKVGAKLDYKTHLAFDSISDALEYLLNTKI